MRYLLTALAATCLSALPAQAISGRATECASSAGGTQIAQSRCYQVASHLPPNMLSCQQTGQTDVYMRPIWICCD